ncbi:MAG TPA: glycine--tRNA ligase subunit beta [Thermoanaerobaculia bacterium]|jgi:glycyl-tRNA synthetase beta chain
MAEYFFELLTEEIPAWMHDAAAATLREKLTAFSQDVTVSSTPRRIIFLLKNLPLREEDREQEVKGPPKKSPEAALQGFLKKQNATAEDIIESSDEYIRIRKKIAGRDTRDLLVERIPEIVESLRWPKMMRWGKGEYSYIRPIHSVISMFEGEHLPISIFGIASGTTTVGHRTLAPKSFSVASYNDYVTKLEVARVYIDTDRRRHAMAAAAIALAKEVDGRPADDPSIWSQWQYLTEYPGLVRAEFRREYLSLPEEVLVTVMRVHQKQLPIRDRNDRLTSSFLAVLDNEGDPDGNAAYGNSFVTNARFADAQFFYDTDRRKKLEERLDQLSHLEFQKKLGNYLDKTRRVEQIARGIMDDPDVALAARLSKADLVTEMVKEFTDLQGRVGGIYAREEGLPANVWQAIYDHYQPVSIDDALPRNVAGAVVSLADRIDTLVGFFSIGAKPTGSKDPFGLRRAAQGVVQILLNRDKREVKITVADLIALGEKAYGTNVPDLHAFFAERVATILEQSAWGFAYDEIRAVMESQWANIPLPDVADRIAALKTVRNTPDFLSVLDSAKRIANITEGHEDRKVDPARLEHATERRLNDLADVIATQVTESIGERQYVRAFESFAGLAPELEAFFKDVMVNVEDAAVQRNRKSLLTKIAWIIRPVADVTKIVVDRRDYRA